MSGEPASEETTVGSAVNGNAGGVDFIRESFESFQEDFATVFDVKDSGLALEGTKEVETVTG